MDEICVSFPKDFDSFDDKYHSYAYNHCDLIHLMTMMKRIRMKKMRKKMKIHFLPVSDQVDKRVHHQIG